ncbi:hypothetical protein P3T18_003414 [Paraburkholderia sp. GAS199]|uniref:bestrophin-like domain n=1 Tax=Paraburkholderia sp. GAS199 TaxID=3035126 RepID=UPI003D1D99B6
MAQLTDHPLILFVFSLVLMSAMAWLGATWLRRARPLSDDMREDFGVVQSATLTLLALVIGFSLSMAVGRYDQRKNYEEEEANAIGTEFIRADLLPSAQAAEVRSLLTQYLQQRIQFYQVRDARQLDEINAATGQLQTQLWAAASGGAKTQPNPVTALAVAGMNDVINTQGYTQAAWWNRIPQAAWVLMLVIGAFANLLVGYGAHSDSARNRFLLIMPIVMALSFALIADIDSPRNGVIRVVPQNLISTAQSLH